MANVTDDADESSDEDLWLCKKAGSDHWQPQALPKQEPAEGGNIILDDEMSDISENGVKNHVIKEYVDLHPRYEVIEEIDVPDYPGTPGASIILDDKMSDTSENGVKNRVIKGYVDEVFEAASVVYDWFEFDDEAQAVKVKFPLYSTGTLTAGGRKGEYEETQNGFDAAALDKYLNTKGFATQTWVRDQSYAKTAELGALSDRVDRLENNAVNLSGYATTQWVTAQGYATVASVNQALSEISAIIERLGKISDLFEFDETAQMIRAKYGVYTQEALTAGKKGNETSEEE